MYFYAIVLLSKLRPIKRFKNSNYFKTTKKFTMYEVIKDFEISLKSTGKIVY